jgi:hypothetical protein
MILENFPRCDCTTLQYHQEIFDYWECLDCGYTWVFDEDDWVFDQDDSDCGNGSSACPICPGSEWVVTSLGKDDCPLCGGYEVA